MDCPARTCHEEAHGLPPKPAQTTPTLAQVASGSGSRLKRLERWAKQEQTVRIRWAGVDEDGVILHGPQPDIASWIGRHSDELPVSTKLYLTGLLPGERPFHPDLA